MKFLITFLIAIALVVLIPTDSEYKVRAIYALEEETKITALTADYKPYKVSGLAGIPDDNEWNVIRQFKHADIITKIYAGESSFGTHDECRRRGLGFNGFGFNESVTRLTTIGPYCYPTFEAVVNTVNDWIETEHLKGTSLSVMNCWYVKGYRVENCDTSYKLN